MDTWLIVLIVVVAVVVLLLVALALSRRSKVAQNRKREQAREHLQEAQVRGAQADKEQALAEEQAARARRERAEVEERAALAEQEARERAAHAEEERAAAEELRARAEKLAPGLADSHTHRVDGTVQPEQAGIPRPDRRAPDQHATPTSPACRAPTPTSPAVAEPPAAEFRPSGPSSFRGDVRTGAAVPQGLDPVGRRPYGRPHVEPSTSEGRHDRSAGHRNTQGTVARPQ